MWPPSSTTNTQGETDRAQTRVDRARRGFPHGARRNAARAIVDWLATDPTGSADSDFLVVGDLNSYAQENPIAAIEAGADDTAGTADDYTNLIAAFQGPFAYSYVFDGQAGYLDQALANGTLAGQVTGAGDWHINADEPDVLDYDTSFKPPAQDALYEPNPYRSSDHDAAVVGLNLTAGPFAGFFQPVGGLPAVNTVNAGQTVPVKFSVSGDQGPGVIASGFPRSAAIACDSVALLTGTETTSTSGNSSVSYDPVTDTYTYAWKTEKSWVGTCRQLVVKLADGTFHQANFRFT